MINNNDWMEHYSHFCGFNEHVWDVLEAGDYHFKDILDLISKERQHADVEVFTASGNKFVAEFINGDLSRHSDLYHKCVSLNPEIITAKRYIVENSFMDYRYEITIPYKITQYL